MNKPFAQSCENNKQAILNVLKTAFNDVHNVVEIGSGTGQHALHFAHNLPHLQWHTSELLENHQGINQWIDETSLTNLHKPIELDLNKPWPVDVTEGIFTANTLHIVSWALVVKFFAGVGEHLAENGVLCIYGPFKYNGEFTSASNGEFDLWLKGRDQHSGIRDIEAIETLAKSVGLVISADYDLPANNRLLVFKR